MTVVFGLVVGLVFGLVLGRGFFWTFEIGIHRQVAM
jgi:hypothetical protein